MNLTALQTEVQARGFDFDTTTRLNYWLNRAYHRICEAEDWIWLQTTTTGTAPLTISDLRSVRSVVDSTNKNALAQLDRNNLLTTVDPDLTTAGAPSYWYRSSDTQVSVYPSSSVSLSVTYIKVPPDLSAGADVPVIPTRYHYALVDGAVIEALKDSDNYDEAQILEQAFLDAIEQMRDTYVYDNFTPDFQLIGDDG